MRVYASVDDLEDEATDAIPRNPDRLLALASTAVDTMLAGCVYTTDSNGLPTVPADAERLKRLTVLQALWMADDPDGLKTGYTVMRTSTVSVEQPNGRPRWAPRAVEYLQATGYPGTGFLVAR